MKKILTILLLLSFYNSGFSQHKEISKIISDTLDNVNFEIRLTRIASEHFNEGKVIGISTQFEINSYGKLINVKARAPMAEIEDLIVSKLRSIVISKSLLEKVKQDSLNSKFALPIRFQVKSESEIFKMIETDKRRKEKETRNRARKN